jgi:hypothetical protein
LITYTVKFFNTTRAFGLITPDSGDKDKRFEGEPVCVLYAAAAYHPGRQKIAA